MSDDYVEIEKLLTPLKVAKIERDAAEKDAAGWLALLRKQDARITDIIEKLGERHTPFGDGTCRDCCEPLDTDGDCPTMRIVKGKT
jgi:hypothetical protein